jgi:hypothetical protein
MNTIFLFIPHLSLPGEFNFRGKRQTTISANAAKGTPGPVRFATAAFEK